MNMLGLKMWLASIFQSPCGHPSGAALPWFQVALAGSTQPAQLPGARLNFSLAPLNQSRLIMSLLLACQLTLTL